MRQADSTPQFYFKLPYVSGKMNKEIKNVFAHVLPFSCRMSFQAVVAVVFNVVSGGGVKSTI